MEIALTSDLLSQIELHCEATYPNEGAGFILGRIEGSTVRVSSLMPLENKWDADEQYHRFVLDTQDFMKAELAAAKHGVDLVGVFHSHPDRPSRPSEFDRDHALPNFAYLITSVQKGKAATTQAWRLTEERDRFSEDNISIS